MNDKLTDEEYWERFWDSVKIPNIARPSSSLHALFKRYLPKAHKSTFFEIGCAPGGWMAYFDKNFHFKVDGIEYAKKAASLTKKNLELLGIDGTVIEGDFFSYQPQKQYDIVFSRGFIEHFENNERVLKLITDCSNAFVVTIIPNLFGINGFISKTFRPEVYKKHVLIPLEQLKIIHEKVGLAILHCNYTNEFRISLPFEKNSFSKKYPRTSRFLNYPVKIVNNFVNMALRFIRWSPSSKLFSPSMICIAVKQ